LSVIYNNIVELPKRAKRAFFEGAEAITRRIFWSRPATTGIP
jgi:hypothetical protein